MIKSKYISDILELLLADDRDDIKTIGEQLAYLTDTEYNYTGNGLFVSFSHQEGIVKHRNNENLILGGVKITTTEYPIEADATIFMADGLIDYLEIWCYSGDYPKGDLKKYTLTQNWENSPERQIIRNE